MIRNLEEFPGLNCTINTTEQCNLRCKYCYEVSKRSRNIDFAVVGDAGMKQFAMMIRSQFDELSYFGVTT